ncbi:hypothetical protein N7490_002611 [Penicillium lividum]|nr:hypothetical protein N7490_002611 [Penicillium lividum]
MVGKLHIPWHYVAAYNVNGQLHVVSANFTNFIQFADPRQTGSTDHVVYTPRDILESGDRWPRNKPLLSSKPYIAGKLDTCANRREIA